MMADVYLTPIGGLNPVRDEPRRPPQQQDKEQSQEKAEKSTADAKSGESSRKTEPSLPDGVGQIIDLEV